MAQRIRKRKCRNCGLFFPPDAHNVKRQRFCFRPECRKASKADSQKRWLEKEQNKDYFRGPANVVRVQQWRQDHPGYWRPKPTAEANPLQDHSAEKALEQQMFKPPLPIPALQDLLSMQPIIILGLIAHLTGSALQDDIAISTRLLQQLGTDILNGLTPNKGGSHVAQVSRLSPSYPSSPQAVQLGGSPSGP
jgi:hypothetical protein